VPNVNDVLEGHVALEVASIDRLFPQCLRARHGCWRAGRPVPDRSFGQPHPSPGSFTKIGNRFRREVRAFASGHGVPVLQLKRPDRTRWDDRRLDHVRSYFDKAGREGRFGVVAVVVAQQFNRAPGLAGQKGD